MLLAIAGLVAAVVVLARATSGSLEPARRSRSALREKDGALQSARESEIQAKANAQEAGRQRVRAEAGEAQARAAVDRILDPGYRGCTIEGPRTPGPAARLAPFGDFVSTTNSSKSAATIPTSVPPWRTCSFALAGSNRTSATPPVGGQRSWRRGRSTRPWPRRSPTIVKFRPGLPNVSSALTISPTRSVVYEKLIKLDPKNPGYRRGLAEAYNSQATKQNDRTKVAEVLEAHRKALALRESLVREFPDDPEAQNNLGGTLNNIGVVLNRQGHTQDALAMYVRAVEQGEAAFAKAPQVTLYGQYLGTQYRNVTQMLLALGRYDEAIRALQKRIEHWKRLTKENPEIPLFRARLYSSSLELAQFLIAQGRKPEAAEWFDLAGRRSKTSRGRLAATCTIWPALRAQAAAAIGDRQGGLTDEDSQERDRLIAAAMDAPAPVDRNRFANRRAYALTTRSRDPPRPHRLPGAACPPESERRRRCPLPAGRIGAPPKKSSRPSKRPWRPQAKMAERRSARPPSPRRPGRQPARCRPGSRRPCAI